MWRFLARVLNFDEEDQTFQKVARAESNATPRSGTVIRSDPDAVRLLMASGWVGGEVAAGFRAGKVREYHIISFPGWSSGIPRWRKGVSRSAKAA
jgi:hypothetical protein